MADTLLFGRFVPVNSPSVPAIASRSSFSWSPLLSAMRSAESMLANCRLSVLRENEARLDSFRRQQVRIERAGRVRCVVAARKRTLDRRSAGQNRVDRLPHRRRSAGQRPGTRPRRSRIPVAPSPPVRSSTRPGSGLPPVAQSEPRAWQAGSGSARIRAPLAPRRLRRPSAAFR